MKVLVIGGTIFVGRHLVDVLCKRGHEVTLFNRGQHADGAHASVRQVHGDRNTDLERLGDASWDAIIDTCAYLPQQVEQVGALFGKRSKWYCVVSSISALDLSQAPVTESTRRLELGEGISIAEFRPENYGPLKALCEDAALKAFGERALIVRPGLIAGPWDPTDRFTYWPLRFARGGDVLVPLPKDQVVQYIDVRDLSEFITQSAERRIAGTINLVGPQLPIETFFEHCSRATNFHGTLRWADEEFLLAAGVAPWMELPLWVPRSDTEHVAICMVENQHAIALGLALRAPQITITDTLVWAQHDRQGELKAGLSAQRESELLSQLQAR